MLGLADHENVRCFTVWFGYNDVGFDTNGDGFTATNSNQEASLRQIQLGATIPEPGTAAMLVGILLPAILWRRR
jgi:hypothetical protein